MEKCTEERGGTHAAGRVNRSEEKMWEPSGRTKTRLLLLFKLMVSARIPGGSVGGTRFLEGRESGFLPLEQGGSREAGSQTRFTAVPSFWIYANAVIEETFQRRQPLKNKQRERGTALVLENLETRTLSRESDLGWNVWILCDVFSDNLRKENVKKKNPVFGLSQQAVDSGGIKNKSEK